MHGTGLVKVRKPLLLLLGLTIFMAAVVTTTRHESGPAPEPGEAAQIVIAKRAHANDSAAKANAGKIAARIEKCFATTENYGECGASSSNFDSGGITMGEGVGAVQVSGNFGTTNYTVVSTSKSFNRFTFARTAEGTTRTCEAPHPTDLCQDGTW